ATVFAAPGAEYTVRAGTSAAGRSPSACPARGSLSAGEPGALPLGASADARIPAATAVSLPTALSAAAVSTAAAVPARRPLSRGTTAQSSPYSSARSSADAQRAVRPASCRSLWYGHPETGRQ